MVEEKKVSPLVGREVKRSHLDPYSEEEAEFIFAVRAYIVRTGKKFPTFSEILGVAKSLGYRKVNDEKEEGE